MTGPIFISHSAADDGASRALRPLLAAALTARNRPVFLDDDDLQPGKPWKPMIYRALAECEGAVLLLSPAALQSPWVLKEASILAWRRGLRACFGHPMTVLTVLLDGVTPDDVKTSFSALDLGEAEFLTLDVSDDAPAPAEQIAAAFPRLPAFADDAMQLWTDDVANALERVDELYLKRAAGRLDFEDPEWLVDGRCLTLAAAMLHTDFSQVEDALWQILRGRPATFLQLLHWVSPGSLPYSSAVVVLKALGQQHKVLAVNATYQQTAERLINRATCCADRFRVVPPVGAVGSADEVYDEIIRQLRQAVGDTGGGPFDPTIVRQQDKFQFVIVLQRSTDGAGLSVRVLRDVLTRLRSQLETVLFVVLTGPKPLSADDLGLPALLSFTPPLDPEQERTIDMAITRLANEARNPVYA